MRRTLSVVFACSLAAVLPAQRPAGEVLADAAWQRDEVGVGVYLSALAFPELFGAPQSVQVLELDAGVDVDVVDAEGRELTTVLAKRGGALAAVNGGFFNTKNGDPVGLLRIDGELLNPANAGQGSFGVDGRGRVHVAAVQGGDWKPMDDALGAGPILVAAGEVLDHGAKQRATRHPRTALGVRKDGSVVLVVVDGRNERAAGMSFEELGAVLVSLGCVEAMNLDGGGSSTMWVDGRGIVNHPCDNKVFDARGERTVANAVLVTAPAVVVLDEESATVPEGVFEVRAAGEDAWRGDVAVGVGAAEWSVTVPREGRYAVFARWPRVAGVREGKVRVEGPGLEATVDQRSRRGRWNEVGEVECEGAPVTVVFTPEPERVLLVDGLRLVERR